MYRNDAKTVSIVALGCFHPITKVQSASLHFFLGSEDEPEEDSDEEEVSSIANELFGYLRCLNQGPNMKSLQHRREINKKTRSADKKLAKTIKAAAKVRLSDFFHRFILSSTNCASETQGQAQR